MSGGLLVYGANGYTGRLIARRAVEMGMRPVLAGRNGAEVGALASTLGLEARVFALDDARRLADGLSGMSVVLHCAGPFSRTAAPMAEACVRAGAHYLDITGEAGVFEAMHARGERAAAAGVMLLPGAGFDVVPSDCLAAHLKRRLPSATRLALAFRSIGGGVSHGTATTMAENAHRGGLVRKNGALTAVPSAWKTRSIDFGRGPVVATTIPWGDVVTAFYSTGIPDIEVYTVVSATARAMLRVGRYLGGVLASVPVQGALRRVIARRPAGPSDDERARASSVVWGEATNEAGQRVVSRLRAPDGYTLTAQTAVATARRALDGDAPLGFQTPSLAYGADLILTAATGVERTDVE
ncbi:MAG: saccharopine dehydrogenase NADP-binding domain-containing protein [Gemmatimonadaceae bacterium]